MKIAFFNTKNYDKYFFDRYNSAHNITYFEAPLNEDTVKLSEGFEAICIFVNDHATEKVIQTLSSFGIRLIVLRCAGFNNVDISAAKKMGITVVRVPAYSPHAVAEHAVALIMTLNRKTHKAYNRVREGNFTLDRLMGFDLYQKTIGVIGTGKIGEAFAKIMLGFGTKVLAFDIFPNEELQKLGVQYLSIEDILAQSDILSLHCPLNEQTKHLINEQSIAKMKNGMMLINTSRGGLIDTKAVIEGLKTKKIAYLGLDVYEQEENIFFKDHSEEVMQDEILARLMSFPNVLISSHQGFFTEEALTQIALISLTNISAFEAGKYSGNEL